MSVGSKDAVALLNFLSPKRIAHQTLENIAILAQQQFSKTDRFKISRILVFLLECDFLYEALSRFVAIYLIWDLCKSENVSQNPFMEFIITYLKNEINCKLPYSAILTFHTFFHQSEQIREFLKYTPLQILELPVTVGENKLSWDFPSMGLNQSYNRFPVLSLSGLPCVVSDEDISSSFEPSFHLHQSSTSDSICATDLPNKCLESILSCGEFIFSHSNFSPEFIRVAPPLMPCPQGIASVNEHKKVININTEIDSHTDSATEMSDKKVCSESRFDSGWSEELIWLMPNVIFHDFHWNASTEQANVTVELRQLISTAMISALNQSQQQIVIQAIKDNPNIVCNLGITSELMPNLVTHNPLIAMEILPILIKSSKHDEYLNSLLKMEVSLQSIEVVNRLSTKVQLPTEFIHNYISNCLQFNHPAQDKYHQMRHVRLVCVLIQSLIRNNILDMHDQDIIIAIRTFCLEFSKVREANSLYRLTSNTASTTASQETYSGLSETSTERN